MDFILNFTGVTDAGYLLLNSTGAIIMSSTMLIGVCL